MLAAAGRPVCAGEPSAAKSTADLDGLVLALGPVASAVHADGQWDGGFGGELSATYIQEKGPLTAVGGAFGGIWFSERRGGRLWLDATVGKRIHGVVLGLSAGPAAEVDHLIPPRWGAQGTLWMFVGVLPYVRLGTVETTGLFVDIGVKIALPALRF